MRDGLAPPPTPRGFSNPVLDSQAVFHAVLETMSRPGRVLPLTAAPDAPAPLTAGAAAVALTLVDGDTPVWLDPPLANGTVADYLRFHTGAPITDSRGDAAFGFFADVGAVPDLTAFRAGTPDYPDRSATLVIQVDHLSDEGGVALSGPGIDSIHRLSAEPLPPGFWRRAQENNSRFPLGVDFLFVTPDAVAAVPRSTRVKA